MTKSKSKRKPHRRRSLFAKNPHWAWWIGGIGVVAVYIWAFYYFFVGPYGFRWRALYGDADYPDGYEIRGIDISHYQGKINWQHLQNAMIEKCPIRFIMIKATEGSTKLDERFNENFRNAREFGFILSSSSTKCICRVAICRLCSMWNTNQPICQPKIFSGRYWHGSMPWKTSIM